ncbi:hypothetical protein O181_040698 [Austropuccinia psidii MF-1]|uniref:Reverse transcriptase RNase H-like domain-containing protein n=1 Tax=Austropuccinia psidii MF-1 TaxID=1389203 RepID=A0A9Q3DHQ6_9BASI|nr:hypothetical protein [Austropuccinia psidii MF-1]
MDLPPKFFHASLEEQWHEEEDPEDIETVLKVVPPAYHKSLDVFSKVKAEKLPPHRACDHHSELEGLLPPIHLCGSYNLLRIREGDDHLTAFRAKYDSYEYLVMPFGLNNAPASFHNLVNNNSSDFLDIFVVVYLNVPSFMVVSLKIIPKISAFNSLLRKDSPLIINVEPRSQFRILKEAVTTAPILSHFNPSLPTIVETDSFNYALGAVLSQVNDSGKHPIAFYTCKLLPAELNYEIHEKELLGIVWALKFWRSFLLSISESFEVFTDHSSLPYFMSSKVLTCRQACWAEFLSELHSFTTYCPGRLATLPDALSCWDDVTPERGVDFISKNAHNFHQIPKKNEIKESICFPIKVEFLSDLVHQIQKAVWQDKDYKEILKK